MRNKGEGWKMIMRRRKKRKKRGRKRYKKWTVRCRGKRSRRRKGK